jgi:tRNA/tmRNA/rRNA uracil-C5-methylase (TrmA/RlmC/RlmD family)
VVVDQQAFRQPDPAAPAGDSWLGRRLELLVGPIAHGGHCVARSEGRVVFVRHALPGETVLAEVTEDRGGSFCRADAVEIRQASPDRVERRCPYAHPGGCGGCDFQHVSLPAQRELKAAVVAEQLSRLAGLQLPVTVQPLDDGAHDDGLGWRRRVRFAVGPAGEIGLRAHRSHAVVPLSHCPIGAPGVGDAAALQADWPGLAELEVAVDDRGEVAELAHRPRPARRNSGQRGQGRGARRGSADRRTSRPVLDTEQLSGPPELRYTVAGRDFAVRPAGFWQTHPRAAEVFTETVLRAAAPQAGDRALDLYAGAGLFTAALAAAVGPTGAVLGLEADPGAVADADANLADLADLADLAQPADLASPSGAGVRRAPVEARSITAAVAELGGSVDIVVLDPPRSGAGREVMAAILASTPRVVVYVACDPAALARDVRFAMDGGWQLAGLDAFDAFPMTHHVECVAVLRPGTGSAGEPGSSAARPGDVASETAPCK